MAVDLGLDMDTVLRPFEGETRAGKDLRDSDDPNNIYRRVRDARNAARDREVRDDNGEPKGDRDLPAIELWAKVWDTGMEYLEGTAKDLEIAAYMIEASIRLGGLSGLAQSLRLTAGLVDNFWGEILPAPDEDGIETTLRPLARLHGGSTTYPLLRIPITEDRSIGKFVLWQYDQVQRLASLMEKRPEEAQKQIEAGTPTLEKLNQAVAETSTEFYVSLLSEAKEVEEALGLLTDAIEKQVPQDELHPNLSGFRTGLESLKGTVEKLAGNRIKAAANSSSAGGGSDSVNSVTGQTATAGSPVMSSPAGTTGGSGPIMNRDMALQQLEEIAAWFEKNEPQSILPLEIRKVVKRGKLTPEELFKDLIDDAEVRRKLFRDVGIAESESY